MPWAQVTLNKYVGMKVLRSVLGWRRLGKVKTFRGVGGGLAGWFTPSTTKPRSTCGWDVSADGRHDFSHSELRLGNRKGTVSNDQPWELHSVK